MGGSFCDHQLIVNAKTIAMDRVGGWENRIEGRGFGKHVTLFLLLLFDLCTQD